MLLHKERKASPRPNSMIGNQIKCQHSVQGGSNSLCKALLFGIGIEIGIKCMLEFSRPEADKLRQRLSEAEDTVNNLRQRLDSKSYIFTTGVVNCSSAVNLAEYPDSCKQTSASALRGTDANFDYFPAAEGLQFTSQSEGGGIFRSNVKQNDSANSTVEIADLAAELEAELEVLQLNLENECSSNKGSLGSYLELDPVVDVVHGELSCCGLPGMHEVRKDKVQLPDISVQGGNWAVCPRELDRRLQILLQSRREEHISELEAELRKAESKLKDKEQLLKALKTRACQFTKLLPSDTPGTADTRIDAESLDSPDSQHETHSLSEDIHKKAPKCLNCSFHESEIFESAVSHMKETTSGKFVRYISSSMGSTGDGKTTPALSIIENVIMEDSNYCTWEDFLGAIDESSQYEGYAIFQATGDSQKNVSTEQVAGQGMDVLESSITKSPLSIKNCCNGTKLPADLSCDYITDNPFECSVTNSPIDESFGITNLPFDLRSDDLDIRDDAEYLGVVDNSNAHINVLDNHSSKETDKHLAAQGAPSHFPTHLDEENDPSCPSGLSVSMPESLYHPKTASTSDLTEQSIKTKKLILSIKNIDSEWSLGNRSYESGPANTPITASLAKEGRLFGTSNSCASLRPTCFSTKNDSTKIHEKIKFWEEVSKRGSTPATELQTGSLVPPEMGAESWSCQGEHLIPMSFTCSERESSSDQSSASDSDEHGGEALIKCIVEKTKMGPGMVRKVQSMLAGLATQEPFPESEEDALLALIVPSPMVSLHATPKIKDMNSCKRSLFEEPL